MVIKNGESGPDVNNREKSSNEELKSMDFLKRGFETKKQTNIITDKSKLADLKEEILESMGNPKLSNTISDGSKKIPELTDKNAREKYSALAPIETRSAEDIDKTATSGIITSVLAPFQAAGRIVIDTGKFFVSPAGEWNRSLDILKDANPDIQNI